MITKYLTAYQLITKLNEELIFLPGQNEYKKLKIKSNYDDKLLKLKYDHLEEESKLINDHLEHILAMQEDFIRIESSLWRKMTKERIEDAKFSDAVNEKVIEFVIL